MEPGPGNEATEGKAPRAFNRHIYHERINVFYGTDDGAQDGSFSEFAEFEEHYHSVAPERRDDIHMVSVVGGLYGLILIPLWRPQRITIFDINPTAISYFQVIRRVFQLSANLPEFLDRLAQGSYEVDDEEQEFVRENIRLKQAGQLPRSRGSSKRSYEESWTYAFKHFDLTNEHGSRIDEEQFTPAEGAKMSSLDDIESVAIHPAIGIGRVGNSPEECFFGPEVPGPHPEDPDKFRDAHGRIKRQDARFRVFGLDADGNVIKEITSEDGEISWRVHVANKKAAWYRFDQALDIPAAKGELSGIPAVASTRRNSDVQGADRNQLVIDPGQRVISGRNVNSDGSMAEYEFDSGTFFYNPVYLGELRTDRDGNLIFLGGKGLSQYKDPAQPNPPVPGFANNPGWHDDTSDGPVDATVRLNNGKQFQATGAWVIVGPPNYAPGVEAFVTGYEQVLDVAVELDSSLKPGKVRFYEHIYPLLERLTRNQWVNAGLARDNGWGSPSDFTYQDLIQRLGDPSDANRPLRQAMFSMFRNPNYEVMEANDLLPVYGDAVTLDINTKDPREWMAILPLQYEWLGNWAAGDFETDQPPGYSSWNQITPAQRAGGLDRAALAETTGGPYHPGCEFTWPMRQAIMYEAPFRIKRRSSPEPDFGDELTSSIALQTGGPLDGSGPGDVTRWMACPWQTDTSSCLSGYRPFSGEYLPTFWPARVPNDVLTEDNYRILMDSGATTEQKEQAFGLAARKKWLRDIVYTDANPPESIRTPNPRAKFIHVWDKVGIVVRQPGPANTPLFPKTVWVETGRTLTVDESVDLEDAAVALRPPMSMR